MSLFLWVVPISLLLSAVLLVLAGVWSVDRGWSPIVVTLGAAVLWLPLGVALLVATDRTIWILCVTTEVRDGTEYTVIREGTCPFSDYHSWADWP